MKNKKFHFFLILFIIIMTGIIFYATSTLKKVNITYIDLLYGNDVEGNYEAIRIEKYNPKKYKCYSIGKCFDSDDNRYTLVVDDKKRIAIISYGNRWIYVFKKIPKEIVFIENKPPFTFIK